ncbi:MAG: nicotinate-nucleotide pyrophosphorylase, partial [Verrucomicrobiota bacterium]
MDERVSRLIDLALEEDIGSGDVTSGYFVPEEREARAFINAREAGVLAGVEVAAEVFRRVGKGSEVRVLLEDGAKMAEGAMTMEIRGKARDVLTAERTALNFLQRLSGVATLTARFVEEVA